MTRKYPGEHLPQETQAMIARKAILETLLHAPKHTLSEMIRDISGLCQAHADNLIDSRSVEINNAPKWINAGDLLREIAEKIQNEYRL